MKRKLRVGTDCSGIEAPIQALIQLGIPFVHVFSSEVDKYCIESIKANYNPQIIFGDPDGKFPEGDITKRNISDVPNIDLYVCGFPCQPFSIAGDRKGFDDKRGNVFWSCLEVITVKKPRYFILENVKGLVNHNNGDTFSVITNELSKLESIYEISWKILNTKDYGIPQNRERLFIVGSKIECVSWPEKKAMKHILDFVDKDDKTKFETTRKYKHKIIEENVFVDFNFIKFRVYKSDVSPCLNTATGLWCVPMDRYANVKEYLMLQGYPTTFKQVVSNRQIKKQIGNSMSINVVSEILKKLIK